jgi:hypothetical protein
MYKVLITPKAAFTQYFASAYNGKDYSFATYDEAELFASGWRMRFTDRSYVVVKVS